VENATTAEITTQTSLSHEEVHALVTRVRGSWLATRSGRVSVKDLGNSGRDDSCLSCSGAPDSGVPERRGGDRCCTEPAAQGRPLRRPETLARAHRRVDSDRLLFDNNPVHIRTGGGKSGSLSATDPAQSVVVLAVTLDGHLNCTARDQKHCHD
jgi:hypothetical protein